VGYERVVYVLDIEEAKKKILAAGGQVFEWVGKEKCIVRSW
jgi:hypothetical protein